jgi:formate dehydrogenase iron-sulfur subunit
VGLAERTAKRDPAELFGILFDVNRCIGCRACQSACKEAHNLPYVPQNQPHRPRGAESTDWNKPDLTPYDYLVMNAHLAEGKDGETKWWHVRRACMHCVEPICFEACFVHAYRKTPEGPVVYVHPEVCTGCRYCQLACPFQAVTLEWEDVFSRISKCPMCYERVQQGHPPACVSACPAKALEFGKRGALLEKARERIKKHPDKYVDHIFGEKEAGGTSVLYIAGVPFEKLGFSEDIIDKSIPKYTWKYISKAPILAVSLPVAFAALYVYTKRRAENEDGGH